MEYVVYDTNIASLAVRGELPAGLAARLPGAVPVISFVTVGELEKWACWKGKAAVPGPAAVFAAVLTRKGPVRCGGRGP